MCDSAPLNRFGARPLPLPATQQDDAMGGREGEWAGAVST